MKPTTSKCLAALTFAVATLVSGTAFALATNWFYPTSVEFQEGKLLIWPDPASFLIAQVSGTPGTPPQCPSQNLDTLKVWHDKAQTALLSGKRLQATFTFCAGVGHITSLAIGN